MKRATAAYLREFWGKSMRTSCSTVLRNALYLLLAVTLIQCSNSDSDLAASSRKSLLPDYDADLIGSCQFEPVDGADASNPSYDDNFYDSGYFGKKMRVDQLNQVLEGSARSIALHLRQLGVQVYSVDMNPRSRCQFFAFLENPTDNALASWQKLSGPSETSRLLGLFTTFFSKNNSNGEVQLVDPTIMVRRDTHKWTLLHEMSHYLFATERASVNHMPFNNELLNQIQQKKNELRTAEREFKRNKKKAEARRLLNLAKEFLELTKTLDSRGPLEEFSIEAMLFDRYQQNLISQMIPIINIRDAYAYMQQNFNSVERDYRRLENKFAGYASLISNANFDNLAKRMTRLENRVSKMMREMFRKVEEVRLEYQYIEAQNFSLNNDPDHQENGHVHGHHDDQEILPGMQHILNLKMVPHYDQEIFDKKSKIIQEL